MTRDKLARALIAWTAGLNVNKFQDAIGKTKEECWNRLRQFEQDEYLFCADKINALIRQARLDERNKVLDEVLGAINCGGCGFEYNYGCDLDTVTCKEHYKSKIEKLRSEE